MSPERLTGTEAASRFGAGWRVDDTTARTTLRAPSFTAGGELIAAIAVASDAAVHHPDVALRYPGLVDVVLTTHDVGGLTDMDVDLAAAIDALAADKGCTPEA